MWRTIGDMENSRRHGDSGRGGGLQETWRTPGDVEIPGEVEDSRRGEGL